MSFFTRHFSIKGMPRKFFRFKTAHIFPRSRIFPFSHERRLFACWETKAIIDNSKCEACSKFSVWHEGDRARCLYEYEMLKSAGYYDEAEQASASSERSAEQEKAEQEKAEREIEEMRKASEYLEKELDAEREELAGLALLLESRSSRSKSSRSKASLFEDRREQGGLEENESECAAEEAEEEDSEDEDAFFFDLPENLDGEESDEF